MTRPGLARRAAHRLGLAILVGATAILVASVPGMGASGSVRAGTDACPTGWADPVTSTSWKMLDVEVLGEARAIAVGYITDAQRRRRMASRRWDGTAWSTQTGPVVQGHDAFVAVAEARGAVWAVGFQERDGDRIVPLAARRSGGTWVIDAPSGPRRGGALMTDVDIDRTDQVWAVGVRFSAASARTALVWRRTDAGWRRVPLDAPRGTALTSVLALAPDDVWAAGSRTTAAGIRPYLVHWDGRAWSSQRVGPTGLDGGLTGLAGSAAGDRWAVGWQTVEGVLRPLVVRDTPKGWRPISAPDLGGTFSLTMDVSLDGQGRPWVVGTTYRDAVESYVAAAARWDTDAWQAWPLPLDPGRWIGGVDGDPTLEGWTVGRTTTGGFLRRACEPDAPIKPRRRPRDLDHRFGASGRPVEDLGGGEPRPVQGLRPVPALPAAAGLPADIVAKDIATTVGLVGDVATYGASVADVDGDGDRDLFISHHGSKAMLRLRQGQRYVPQAASQFRRVDRHDCELGLIDAGPLPDLVCSVGGERGLGLKANQLYLDPATGASTEVAAVLGVADAFGRGRKASLFDADGDADLDLFLGVDGMRPDALPSVNRLLRNDGTGHFTWDPASGLGSERGATCAMPTDLDRDGDQDLVLCTFMESVVGTGSIVVYRNEAGSFRDVTGSIGVRPIGEVDAAAAQLGGSRRPDLVQLSTDRIRISLWSAGRYRVVHERRVPRGRALAIGDVNGDGALDVYLMLGDRRRNDPDVVLLNGGDGRSWTTASVPGPTRGAPEDVVALDHDGNGLTDFLVLNGHGTRGPMGLIVFKRR